MNPLSIFAALLAVVIALATAKLIGLFGSKSNAPMKYQSIEGLRGYLAFFVFLNHSSVWYLYLRNNGWHNPPSNLYSHFADYSVAMFFMITSFLFFSKLIDAKTKPIDWLRFFTSRIMRLTPLYIFALTMTLLIVGVLSGFMLNESSKKVIYEVYKWGTFTIRGAPAINGEKATFILLGVAWSLRYEWLFYFSLPLIGAAFFRAKSSILTLAIAGLVVFWIYYNIYPVAIHLLSFGGGIAAAFLTRSEKVCEFASKKAGAAIAIVCLISSVVFFPMPIQVLPLILLSIAFNVFACGNTLFGLLTNQASRILGNMAYSIYLLHSILLFIVFRFIIGFETAALITPFQHWLIIWSCSAVLVLICFATYHFIELPSMNAVVRITTISKKITSNIRQLLQKYFPLQA